MYISWTFYHGSYEISQSYSANDYSLFDIQDGEQQGQPARGLVDSAGAGGLKRF